jgi:membrane associated rhomboid family serine protease
VFVIEGVYDTRQPSRARVRFLAATPFIPSNLIGRLGFIVILLLPAFGHVMPATDPPRSISLLDAIKDHLFLLFGLLGLMWLVEILDLLPFIHFDRYGIHPRSASGLIGIVLAPILHAGFGHLLANSLPFVILGGIVLMGGTQVFWKVTIFVTLAGGFCVWLFAGRFTNHIGASGLIFGYLGFLLARGFFEGSLLWMLVAGVIMLLYGGLLFGVFPSDAGISWQGHLFGFLAGIGAARLIFPSGKTMLHQGPPGN